MLYQGRNYAIEAFIEQTEDSQRLAEHKHVLVLHDDDDKYDVSECSLECVEGKTFKIRLKIRRPIYRRRDLSVSCFIDAEDREVDGVYLKREQKTWTFRQMSYEDDIGDIVIADMQFATRPTTDNVREAEVTGKALSELGKISLEIQEGELVETGVMVKGRGSAAAASAGVVYENDAKLGSTVIGANARPAPSSEYMGVKFFESINPKICRMVWKYGTRASLISKEAIGPDDKPSSPRYVDSDYSNDTDPSDSDHSSDDSDGGHPWASDDDLPGPSTRPAKRSRLSRKRKQRNDSGDDSADEDFKLDGSQEDIKPKREAIRRGQIRDAKDLKGKGKGKAKDEEVEGKKPRAISTRTRSKKWGQPDSDGDDSGSDGFGDARRAGPERAGVSGGSGRMSVKAEQGSHVAERGDPVERGGSGLPVKVEEPDQRSDSKKVDQAPKVYIVAKRNDGEIIDLTEDD